MFGEGGQFAGGGGAQKAGIEGALAQTVAVERVRVLKDLVDADCGRGSSGKRASDGGAAIRVVAVVPCMARALRASYFSFPAAQYAR